VEHVSNGVDAGDTGLLLPGESLTSGIWPRSFILWMAAFWMALVIIRPWELMFPELAPYHLPRVYAIIMLVATACLGRLQLFSCSFQTLCLIAFVLALAVSSLVGLDAQASWTPLYTYLTLAVFYFVLLAIIRTPYELLFIVSCYIVVMAMALGKAEVEFFVFGAHSTAQGVRRMLGINNTFGDPNAVAEMTVVSLPIALFLWRIRKEFTQTWPAFLRVWFPRGVVIYFVLAVTSVFLTQSRAGMIGFAVFVFLSVAMGKGYGKMVSGTFWAACLLAVLWMAMPDEYRNRLETVWNPEAGPESAQLSAEGRTRGMRAGLVMFERFPFTGVGPGNFLSYRVAHVDGEPLIAHSLIGQSLGETGMLGTGTFVLFVIAVLLNCRRTGVLARHYPHPTTNTFRLLALACTHSTILLAVFGLALHNMYRVQWLWTAVFALLAWSFSKTVVEEEVSSDADVIPQE